MYVLYYALFADEPHKRGGNIPCYRCFKEKSGIQELTDKLHEVTNIDTLNIDEGKFLANQRQIDLMKKSYQHLLNAKDACEMGIDVDLIEIDLKQAFDYLGNITGDSSPEELITALFTKFCLGK